MGGGMSKHEKEEAIVLALVNKTKPSYYIHNVVLTEDDIRLTTTSWRDILACVETNAFQRRKKEDPENFEYLSISLWFFDAFYNRFFETCADARHIFSGERTSGKVIENLISSAFDCGLDQVKIKEVVCKLTCENYVHGIKAAQYGAMGEALLWALDLVLGEEFDDKMKSAWTRVYSYLLNIILVKAAECEVTMVQDQQNNPKAADKKVLTIRRIFSSESVGMIYKMVSGDREDEHDISLRAQMAKYQPDYFIADVDLTEDDVSIASKAWFLLMSGENTEPFAERKRIDPNFEYSSSLTWFYDAFYGKFFELYPAAKPLFAHVSMVAQGKLIAGLISSSLESVREPIKVNERLRHVAYKHSQRGIKAEQYGVMGHALLWVLELVIGKSFDAAAKTAWTRIYCHILNIILPVAAEYEVNKRQQSASNNSSGKLASIRRVLSGSSIYSSATGESSKCPKDKIIIPENNMERKSPLQSLTEQSNNDIDSKTQTAQCPHKRGVCPF